MENKKMKQEKEHWFVAEIYTKKPSGFYRKKLFNFIMNAIPRCDPVTWHFFHEDWDKSTLSKEFLKKVGHFFPKQKKGNMFVFRVRLRNKEDIEEAHKEFNKHKHLIKGIYTKILFPKYYGEAKYYSEMGWSHAQQYFYACSFLAIYMFHTDPKKYEWLYPGKFVHTFLNQLGYGTWGEFNFYLERAKAIKRSHELWREE